MIEHRVEMVSLPISVPGLISFDEDGYPTILINDRLSYPAQQRAFKHEYDHLKHDDIHTDDLRSAEHRAGTV